MSPEPLEIEARIASGPALRPVMGRLLGALAARADLPVDRLSDALLLSDALSAGVAPGGVGPALDVWASAAPRTLRVRVGPLPDGGADRLRAAAPAPGGNDVIGSLADEVVVERDGVGEYLVMRLS